MNDHGGAWRDVWLVARRELTTRGRSRSFLIGLVLSAVLVAGLAALPRLLGGETTYDVGLVDGGQALQPAIEASAAAEDVDLTISELPDRSAAREAVVDGEVDAAVVHGEVIWYDRELDTTLSQLLDSAHRTVEAQERLRAAGLDPAAVNEALAVPPLERTAIGETGEASPARRILAAAVVVLMFMLIYLPAVYVAMGVVEEKGSRIVELLLAAVRPWQLLTGKVAGIGLLSLGQLTVIAGAGLGSATVAGVLPDLPEGTFGVVASTFLWFLLGYAFFAAVAAAAASLVSRQEDVNGVLTPVMMLLMVAYGVGFFAIFSPGSAVANVLSVAPPFSVIVMPVRAATAPVPAWEIVAAVLLMLAATAAVVAAGARVYEQAVLRTGARVRLAEVIGRGRGS